MGRTLLLGSVVVVLLSACTVVERVNVTESGAQSPHSTFGVQEPAAIDDDGDVVVFATPAYLTANDDVGVTDVYVRDRVAGRTKLASISTEGEQDQLDSDNPSVSGNGRYVAFTGRSGDLLPIPADARGTNLYVKDRRTGTLERIIIPSDGVHRSYGTGDAADFDRDGRYLAFSWGQVGEPGTVWVLDRATGGLEPAGVSDAGEVVLAFGGSISDDGRSVVFTAKASEVVDGSPVTSQQVFVRDLDADTTTGVSTHPSGAFLAGSNWDGWLSGDGRSAVITQVQAPHHVYRKDLVTGALEQIDRSGCEPAPTLANYAFPSISADGRTIAFNTPCRLVADDRNGVDDVYVWMADRPDHLRMISRSSHGAPGNDESYWPVISGDGLHVVFVSNATNLVRGDTNGVPDVFVWTNADGPTRVG